MFYRVNMDTPFIPPIWKRLDEIKIDGNYSYKNHPSPDWNTVGPIINAPTSWDDGTSTSSRSLTGTVIKSKDIFQKFPFVRSMKFCYPLRKPMVLLAKHNNIDTEDNFVFRHGGNALDMIDFQGKTYLFHPVFGDLSTQGGDGIMVSKILPKTHLEDLGEGNQEDVFYHLREYSKLNFREGGECLQLQVKVINGTGYVLNRTKYGLQFYVLNDKLGSESQNLWSFGKSKCMSSIALNELIPGYFAAATSTGVVSLYCNPVSKNCKPIWETQFTGKTCYQCLFGRNSFHSLLVNNELKVWLCDTRKKHEESKKPLLDIESFRTLVPSTDIISKVTRSGYYYLNMITSKCILQIDERNIKTPVMKWNHAMYTPLSFVTQNKIKDADVLMMTNSLDYTICAVTFKGGDKKPVTSCLPRHFNCVRDTMKFAQNHNMWFSHHTDRLGSLIIGLSSYVNPKRDSSICALTANRYGDVFLQDFQWIDDDKENNRSHQSVAACEEIGKKLLKDYEERVIDASIKEADFERHVIISHLKDKNLGKSPYEISRFSTRKKKEGGPPIPHDLTKYFRELEKSVLDESNSYQVKKETQYKSDKTESKAKDSKKLWSIENYVLNSYSSPGNNSLPLIVDDNSDGKEGLAKYIPAELAKHIQPSYLDRFTDEKSLSLLKVWQDDDKEINKSKSGIPELYGKAPFDLNCLVTHPAKLKKHEDKKFDYINESSINLNLSDFFAPVPKSESFSHSLGTLSAKKDAKRTAKKKRQLDGF